MLIAALTLILLIFLHGLWVLKYALSPEWKIRRRLAQYAGRR